MRHPTVRTERALSEEFKARMSLKTQVPRLSVLINNNRDVSDVSEFRAKKIVIRGMQNIQGEQTPLLHMLVC